MKINSRGLQIIKESEGLRLDAYLCPAGILTIGYGHCGDVKPGDTITEHQADAILDVDLARFEHAVERMCPHLGENQFSALVSFAFNNGIANLEGSHLMRFCKAGDWHAAADEFPKWNHAAGKVLPGLTRRRLAERDLFLSC